MKSHTTKDPSRYQNSTWKCNQSGVVLAHRSVHICTLTSPSPPPPRQRCDLLQFLASPVCFWVSAWHLEFCSQAPVRHSPRGCYWHYQPCVHHWCSICSCWWLHLCSHCCWHGCMRRLFCSQKIWQEAIFYEIGTSTARWQWMTGVETLLHIGRSVPSWGAWKFYGYCNDWMQLQQLHCCLWPLPHVEGHTQGLKEKWVRMVISDMRTTIVF